MTRLPLGITPRGPTREQAAEYCGCESLSAFDDWRRRGTVPDPMRGTNRGDRKAIDRALDRLSGLLSKEDEDEAALEAWLVENAGGQPDG